MKIIGFDIGGTKIEAVLWDQKKVLRVVAFKTPKNKTDFLQLLKKIAADLSSGQQIGGIGVGMAGWMDFRRKIAISSPNIAVVNNLDFKKIFPGKKISLENDANCFALAESLLGQGRKAESLVGVTFGTGVGGGMVLKKTLLRGAHFRAGEVGHTVFGGRGDFESFFQQFRDKQHFKNIGQMAGLLMVNICRIFDPEVIVLGGSVGMAEEVKLLETTNKVLTKYLQPKERPKIYISKLKHAGAIGAALLVQ